MKSLSTFCIIFLFSIELVFAQLEIAPQYPQPGDEITLTYDKSGSSLADVAELEIILYAFADDQPNAHLLTAQEMNTGKLVASFQIDDQTKLISVKVRDVNDHDNLDVNGSKGYQKLIYNGQQPVAGAYLQKAALKNSWARVVGIDRDVEKAVKLMEKEVELYGPLQDEDNLSYIRTLARVDQDKANEKAQKSLTTLETKKKKSEIDYINMINYANVLKDDELKEKLEEKVLKKFKNGEYAVTHKFNEYFDTKDWDKKYEIFKSIDPNSLSENQQNTYAYMLSQAAQHFAQENDWEQFEHYANQIEDERRLASMYNGLAWNLSGESIDSVAENPEKGLQMAEKALEYLDQYFANTENKPGYYIEKDWLENKKYSVGMYSDTYALNAYHAGDYQKALEYQQASCEANEFSDPEMNERFATYYGKIKGPKATGELLENMIRDGQASSKMKDQFKQIFLEHYSLEDAYGKYMAELEKESMKKMEEELVEQLIDLEAPEFVLKNLQGEEVSLESLKGKVVVLDFWATWCGPCIASFPGMQQAVDKYVDDSEVEFLFVDTWESVDNKEENASKFINDNEYSFHVLMDVDNKAVTDYKVEGIPTKFIIDKNQRIRFKSIGFSGSAEKLVNELSLMINHLKKADSKNKVSLN